MAEQPTQQELDRANRYTSHALVEVRKFKHLPFYVRSGVLLDISIGGFKLEFTGETIARPGEKHWLNIPLTPLGIYAPPNLTVRTEVRWFDDRRYRVGGVFVELTDAERLIVEQVIESLRKRGFLS